MTKSIVFASVFCVISFLLGSAAHVNGNADEQQAAPAPPQRSFIERYQMITPGPTRILILDTATGKYLQQAQHLRGKWIEIYPIGDRISQVVEDEAAIRAVRENQDAQNPNTR